MYNRYMPSDDADVRFSPMPTAPDAAPLHREAAYNAAEPTEAVSDTDVTAHDICVPAVSEHPDKLSEDSEDAGTAEKTENAREDGLTRLLSVDSETLIVIGLALFLMCDKLDDISDTVLILILLLAVGF